MEDIVAIVSVGDALHPILQWRLHSHKEREEKASIRQNVAESVHEEEKDRDELSSHCSCHKLSQHDFGSTMGKCAMSEKQVRQPIQILHLNVSAGKHIALLVVLNESDSDVCLANCKLVRLLGNDADHVSELALDSKLSNCLDHILALNRSH